MTPEDLCTEDIVFSFYTTELIEETLVIDDEPSHYEVF